MDDGTLTQYQKIAEEVENAKKLSARQLHYLKKYAPKIDVLCCKHKGIARIQYHIGYIGLRCCKVAICCDCGCKQVICGRLSRWILRRFLNKGIRRINILATLSMQDMFMYR